MTQTCILFYGNHSWAESLNFLPMTMQGVQNKNIALGSRKPEEPCSALNLIKFGSPGV